MKTSFFLENELDEKDIERIKTIQAADEGLFSLIKNWYLDQPEFPRINRKLTKEFASKTNKSAEEVNKVIKSIFFLNRLFIDYEGDTVDNFIDDIKVVNPSIIVDETTFKNRLDDIQNISSVFRMFVKSETAKSAGAPMLDSSNTSVILKPVIDEIFDFDKQDIKDYNPQIVKYEPCVLIQLKNSNGKSISFQMDSESYERFLNNLIALQIELKAAKDDRN